MTKTILGTFKNSKIYEDNGNITEAYPYRIDYDKINNRRAFYQLRNSLDQNLVGGSEHRDEFWTIINWIFTD